MKKLFGFGSSTPPPPVAAPAPSGESAGANLLGKWKETSSGDVTEFHPDGSVTEKAAGGETIRGRYTLEGAKLKLRLEGVKDELVFAVTLKGKTLEMTGPDAVTMRCEKIS